MRRRVVWAGLVFAALVALTWWTSRDRKPAEEPPFFALRRRLPDTLLVAVGADTTVMVTGGETGWQLIHPVRYPADPLIVESLLARLSPLKVAGAYALPETKMDTYGIRFPQALVRAAYRDGLPPDTVTVGSYTLDGGFVYVRANSEPRVGLVPASTVRGTFARAPFDWQDLRLLPFNEAQAVRFILLREGEPRVALRRDPDAGWIVEKPFVGPGSSRKIGEYLKSLSHMHIRSFPPEDPRNASGFAPPRAGALVELTDGTMVGCDIGDPWTGDPEVHLARKSGRREFVGVSYKYLPVLERAAESFRETLPVTFGLRDVDSVAVFWAGGSGGVARPGDVEGALREHLGAWLLLEAVAIDEARPGVDGLDPGAPVERLVWYGKGDTLAVEHVGALVNGRLPVLVPGGSRARSEERFWLPGPRGVEILRGMREALGGSVEGVGGD